MYGSTVKIPIAKEKLYAAFIFLGPELSSMSLAHIKSNKNMQQMV